MPVPAATDRYLEVNGLTLRYRDLGDPAATPILFLHGLMGHADEWEVLVADLAADHRIVVPDQRGHGRSDWAPTYRAEAMVADVVGLIESLGLHGTQVAGHSMGGVIAMLLAAQRPDLIDRLALIDIGPASLDTQWGRQVLPEVLQHFALTSYGDIQQAVDEWLDGDRYTREPLMRNYVEHALKQDDTGRWIWRFDAAHLYEFVGTLDSDQLRHALDRIIAPTLLIRGAASELLTKTAAAEALGRLHDGRLVEIPAGAHDLGVQQPEAVAAAIRRFLASADTR